MPSNRPTILGRVGCSALLCVLVSPAPAATLKKIEVIDLPNPPGKRFDYLTIDYEDHYLLSAHLAAGILYVIDTADNRLVKAIPGVPGVEGVEYVPGLKKVYTSDSGDDQIGIVDLRAMKMIKTLPTAAKPDGSAFAEPFRKLYVSDGKGKAAAIVDVDKAAPERDGPELIYHVSVIRRRYSPDTKLTAGPQRTYRLLMPNPSKR